MGCGAHRPTLWGIGNISKAHSWLQCITALGAPATYLVANCKAKQKMGFGAVPMGCFKAVGQWAGVPQQLPVYIDSVAVIVRFAISCSWVLRSTICSRYT